MQIAALNIRSEADAIAKRFASKGYAAYVMSPALGYAADLPGAHRQVRLAPRSGNDGDEAGKRRAAQTLGYPLALASGVLLALSFPKFGHPAFSWIALAPLLVALARPATTRRDVSARPDHGRRLLRRNAVLDHRGHGPLRRAAVRGSRSSSMSRWSCTSRCSPPCLRW